VSLLIFDECHHTRKNHAYNGIMREYHQCPVVQRPKIFGMTASPIWNAKDAVNSLAALEKNLNATVVAVQDHVAELSDHSPRPKEVTISRPWTTLHAEDTSRTDNKTIFFTANGLPVLPSTHPLESM
jgi:endoribonuclease Dicer